MLIYAFRRRLWVVVLIIAADLLIAAFVGDTLIRWELEQLRKAFHPTRVHGVHRGATHGPPQGDRMTEDAGCDVAPQKWGHDRGLAPALREGVPGMKYENSTPDPRERAGAGTSQYNGLVAWRAQQAEAKRLKLLELEHYRAYAETVERDGQTFKLVRIPDRYDFTKKPSVPDAQPRGSKRKQA